MTSDMTQNPDWSDAAGLVADLSRRIGHDFGKPELALAAVTHSSYAHEQRRKGRKVGPDNERLEFLGDAVLGLLMAELLMGRYPEASEGRLSRARSFLVSEASLARIAGKLGLGAHLRLGKGEELGGGRAKPSLLADALEALIAAVYLDGGLSAARDFVEFLFHGEFESFGESLPGADPKSRVQELAQAAHLSPPGYSVVDRRGPDHAARFEVAISLEGKTLFKGWGGNKKQAEKDAAARLLAALEEQDITLEGLLKSLEASPDAATGEESDGPSDAGETGADGEDPGE